MSLLERHQNWIDHLLGKFEALTISSGPVAYFHIRDVFHPELYGLIEKYWPREDYFLGQVDVAQQRLGHVYANLRKVVLIEDAPELMPSAEGGEFWQSFRMMMSDRRLLRKLIERIVPHLRGMRTDLKPPIRVQSDLLLQIDTDGFNLSPHLDSWRKLLSMVFYLPHDDSRPELGTSVFTPRPEFVHAHPDLGRKFFGEYYPFEQFNETYRAPFVPNSVFGFVVTPLAFHGVQEVKNAGGWRRNILMNLYHQYEAPYQSVLKRNLIKV